LRSIKLASKTRVDGRMKRAYHQAHMPYQRVMAWRQIHRKTKEQLKATYESLNPSAAKSEIVLQGPWRGPDITINKATAISSAPTLRIASGRQQYLLQVLPAPTGYFLSDPTDTRLG
jgi:hypothetical protein